MILMRANPLPRPLEGVGPEILTFLGIAHCHFRFQNSLDFRAHPFQWPALLLANRSIYKFLKMLDQSHETVPLNFFRFCRTAIEAQLLGARVVLVGE
jgi:hypothetical protein